MTITADTPVANVAPRLSREGFIRWLQQVHSPAAADGAAPGSYDAIVAERVDPLFLAAVFWEESNAATNPSSMVVKHDLMNPGDCRSSQTGVGVVIATERGAFVRYPSWNAGWRDLAYRLVAPRYVYASAGLTTIGEIIPKLAPASDGNDPTGYIAHVVAFMSEHQDIGREPDTSTATYAGDDLKAVWMPTSNFDTGRGGDVIDHITCHGTYGAVGANSLNWLRGAKGGTSNTDSSATYLIGRDGTMWQLVKESDTAWADGNLLYNQSGISIEHEHAIGQDWPLAQIIASVGLISRIARRQGWTAITHPTAAVLPEGGPAGTANLIGHCQVPDPNNPTLGGGESHHTGCPGADFPWDQVVRKVNAELTARSVTDTIAEREAAPQPPTPEILRFSNGKTLQHGFRAFWQARGGLPIFGMPITDEIQENGLTVQYTQRARLEYHPANGDAANWNVELGLVASQLLAARQQIQGLNAQLIAVTPKRSLLQRVGDTLGGGAKGMKS